MQSGQDSLRLWFLGPTDRLAQDLSPFTPPFEQLKRYSELLRELLKSSSVAELFPHSAFPDVSGNSSANGPSRFPASRLFIARPAPRTSGRRRAARCAIFSPRDEVSMPRIAATVSERHELEGPATLIGSFFFSPVFSFLCVIMQHQTPLVKGVLSGIAWFMALLTSITTLCINSPKMFPTCVVVFLLLQYTDKRVFSMTCTIIAEK